jgi:3-deoxy-D-manno-octulosonic acid (KDO) 8-phosphate synthase
METHVNPVNALSDKDNAIKFSDLAEIWRVLRKIHDDVAG